MVILPAIDIRNKKAVRLYKGDFNRETTVSESPLATALEFERAGATWLHIVDLDGALAGTVVNGEIIREILSNTSLNVELGGGIRNMNTVDELISLGVRRVIIGSAAVNDRDFLKSAVSKYGDKIAVGIDAKEGLVKTSGWLDNSGIDYIDFAKRMEDDGVKTIIFTDIERDGTLQGPNVEQLKALCDSVSCDIIASGGISDIHDLQKLSSMRLMGAITGKAIYEGTLSLKDALKLEGQEF